MGRRRHQRWAIRVAGSYRSPAGEDIFVSVGDVSAHGCCVLRPSRNLFVGDHVLMMIDGLEPVAAEVRWQERGERAGLCFPEAVDAQALALLVAHCGARVQIVPEHWRSEAAASEASL